MKEIRLIIGLLVVSVLITLSVDILVTSRNSLWSIVVITTDIVAVICTTSYMMIRFYRRTNRLARIAHAHQMEMASCEEQDKRYARHCLCGQGQFPSWRG